MKNKASGIISEFKKFISRGNVIDMAVGIIMGTAFTAIVTSFVNGIVMPIVGFFIGGVNFADFKIVLKAAVGDIPEVAITYGDLIQQIVNFLIIALVVFAMVKLLNNMQKKKEPEAPTPEEPSDEVKLLTEIRDLMKK